MSRQVTIRLQELSDAPRFLEILNSGKFPFFPARVKSLPDEIAFIKRNIRKRRTKELFDFSIICDNHVVGAIGVRPNPTAPHVAELGYFVDRNEWGQGIATEALRQAEGFAHRVLKIKRLELVIATKNTASVRVAEKAGYQKESTQTKRIAIGSTLLDAFLYVKLRSSPR